MSILLSENKNQYMQYMENFPDIPSRNSNTLGNTNAI